MDDAVTRFRERVWDYFDAHGRDLPWRRTDDPYAVLVSEVMLQQTQVSRVVPKYEEFMRAFPDVRALAAAPLHEVLRVWSGLGYNRRAKMLKEAAAEIVSHGGRVPATREGLMALPGVGPATAAEVLAFAFGIGVPFIETNVRAVYLHEFFGDAEDVPDAAILPLVEATLDPERPREWYWALMDYGTHLKAALPNPSRRSRHHTRQAPFEGSNRQLRGRLVLALVGCGATEHNETPGCGLDALASTVGFERSRVEAALSALRAEGLAAYEDGRWRIG